MRRRGGESRRRPGGAPASEEEVAEVEPYTVMLAARTATVLVSRMPAGSWETLREAVTALWRTTGPAAEQTVRDELDEAREQLLGADNRAAVRSALVLEWSRRFSRLLEATPAASAEVQELLDATEPDEQSDRSAASAPPPSLYTMSATGPARHAVGSFSQFIRDINRDT
jgi:hypothetical protein